MRRLRRFYWRHIRRHRYEICHECGRPVFIVWSADDALFAHIHGSPWGIRCVPCFDAEAIEQGIYLRWTPGPL